jgi:hypothetical protein
MGKAFHGNFFKGFPQCCGSGMILKKSVSGSGSYFSVGLDPGPQHWLSVLDVGNLLSLVKSLPLCCYEETFHADDKFRKILSCWGRI